MSEVSKEAIRLEIVKFVRDNVGKDLSSVSTSTLFRECGLDSMAVLDIVFHLEELYGIKIDDLALTRESTLDDVLGMVETNVRAR
jgi:acyl carrier protein